MAWPGRGIRKIIALIFLLSATAGVAQAVRPEVAAATPAVTLTVTDENGLAVPGAQVTIQEPGHSPLHRGTDYAGRCEWIPQQPAPYIVRVEKPGFYQSTATGIDPGVQSLRIVLAHEQVVREQVNVTASTPGIDPEQISDRSTMNTPEIVNIPYPTNRDIRNLLPFTPGVVADPSGQVHVAGGSTYMTLYTLDGFDIRSPIDGTLDLRVSTDAVRSVDTESTRYPVEYGRSAAGVIAFNTGMGDNRFRFNATDFLPSFREVSGIHFDKLVPRFTVSGPVRRNRAWFFDGVEVEYDNIYIPELPPNEDTDHLIRGSNLLKFQVNLGARNSLSTGLLFNDFHSPYDGISALTPQQSTDNHNIQAWLPYVRDQQGFKNGVVLETGFGVVRYSEGFEPHGTLPYELTPELPSGSNFETLTSHAQRVQGTVAAYLPLRHWEGTHQLKAGIDLDHVGFDETAAYAPVSYLREDRTLSRLSTFPQFATFNRHNLEFGAYLEDRWSPLKGLLLEPGVRLDWDAIIRRPLFSPRIAASYSPPGAESTTKLTVGIGVYYDHTQLEYLARAQAGIRYDTYYAADGVTPTGPSQETAFTENDASLHESRALNWSAGVEHRLPGNIFAGASFIQKRLSNAFVYANQSGTGALAGNYLLTNDRQDHYYSAEVNARRDFAGGYALFGSYTRSSSITNTAINYVPTVSILGPQQAGPLSWDAPNRVLSWGWLPAWAPRLPKVRKNWDFVYAFQWQTGFPFDSIDTNEQIVGSPGSHRFPNYLSLSPGLEWRFHFRGKYFGLRGLIENITGSMDPYFVYNNVDSPQYLTFTQPQGRAFTTRIRLIESK
jgi:hypothetical protein